MRQILFVTVIALLVAAIPLTTVASEKPTKTTICHFSIDELTYHTLNLGSANAANAHLVHHQYYDENGNKIGGDYSGACVF